MDNTFLHNVHYTLCLHCAIVAGMELIGRVLNALVGDKVKKYRNNMLFRVNTVAFRTDLAVKSEKRK